ncbi:MAG: hypothetical protein ABEJ68_10340 [Halobacteriaceae archaeon]
MRAQAHTLEAFVAALLVLGGVVFAIQATAVTPLSASTSNQHIENQQRAQATDLLTTTHANDSLRSAVFMAWNATYQTNYPREGVGVALNRTFGDPGIAFNVRVTATNASVGKVFVNQGTPTDNAVTASHPVVLFDDTPHPDPAYANVSEWAQTGNFNVPDSSPDTEVYAVMEVHITVWRI